MMHAPEMSPTLDDAIRAFERSDQEGHYGPADFNTLRAFLAQLDEVREVPAVVLDRAQAEHLEGAYLAGVRCADESGHVLVMSLPAFLQLCPPPVPVAPPSWLAKVDHAAGLVLRRPYAFGAAAFALAALVAVLVDGDAAAAGWLAIGALTWGLLDQVRRLPPTSCTYRCNSGRACTCAPQPMKEPK